MLSPILKNTHGVQRTFFLLVVLILGYKANSHTLLSQLSQPVLGYAAWDITYWLFAFTGIAKIFSSSPYSFFLDIVLFSSALLSVILVDKKVFPLIFLISYFVYFVVFNFYAGHHYHDVGILILSVPFIFKSKNNFTIAFLMCRYYLLFMLVSACGWKIYKSTMLQPYHFSAVLEAQNIEALILNSNGLKSRIIFFLIENHAIAQCLWIVLMMLQALFAIGFFTRKYDYLLIITYSLFAIGGYILMDIVMIENTILLLTLHPITSFKLPFIMEQSAFQTNP